MEQIELDVYDASGKQVSKRKVSASAFGAEVKENLLHQVVRWQRARKRAGTHSVKTRAEVRGGGAKPFRQKGTGRARAGTKNSPIWVGGGVAHGPKPRSYDFRLNKQERALALSSALSARTGEGQLKLLKGFDLEQPKTQAAKQVLDALGLNEVKKVLVVVPEEDTNSTKSLRNLDGVTVLGPEGLNVYDVLNSQAVVICDDAVEPVEARCA